MPGKTRKAKEAAEGLQPSKSARRVKKKKKKRGDKREGGRASAEDGRAGEVQAGPTLEEAAVLRKASAEAALDALSEVEALFAGKLQTLREALTGSVSSVSAEVAVPADTLAALRKAVADLSVVRDGAVSCGLCDQGVRRSSVKRCNGCKQEVCRVCAAACIVCSVKAEKAVLPKAAREGILVPDTATARKPYRLAVAAAYNAIGEAWQKLENNDEALRLHTKALAFREELTSNSPDLAETYANIGRVHYDRDEYAEALEWYSRSRQIREEKDPDSLALAKTIRDIGCVFLHQGKLAEALTCYKTSVQICEEQGPDSFYLAMAYQNIGVVYFDQENYGEALEWYNKARLIYEKKPKEKGLKAAQLYFAIGIVHYEQDALDEALRWCKEARTIQLDEAPNSLALAATHYRIGAVYRKQEEYKQALVSLHKARQLRAENEPDSLAVAVTYKKIGRVCYDQGKFNTALDWYRKACMVRETKEPESPDLVRLYDDIGYVYSEDLEVYDEALVWYKKSCAVEEKAAPHSLDLAKTYYNLGTVYYDLEAEGEALSSFHRSRVIREEKAPDSLELAESYCFIGRTHYHWDREGKEDKEEARGWLHRAQEIAEKKAPKEYKVLASTYDYLGRVYDDQEKYVEALVWHNKSLLLCKEVTPGSLSIPTTYDAIAGVYYSQDELDKALTSYEKASRLYCENEPLANTYSQMGYVYDDQGKSDEAVASYHKARVIRENDAPNSLELAETYHCLGRACSDLEKYDEALHWHILSRQIREYHGPDLDLAKTYFRIGDVHAAQDKHDEALDWYKKSLKTCETAPDRHLAELYNSIGAAHSAEERYEDALAWFNKSHPKHEPGTVDVAIIYYHIGRVCSKQGDFDVALEWYTKSRLIEEEEVPDSLDVAQTYSKIGRVYREKGAYDKALEWYNKARVIRAEEEPDGLDLEWTHQDIQEVKALSIKARRHGHGESSDKEPRRQTALPQLPMDDYEPLGKEGFGSSGEVSTWRHKMTAVRAAVKEFKQQKGAFFDREVDALSRMQRHKERSPFVVAMLSHGQVRGHPAIRMECCDGDLRARIVRLKQENRQFSNGEIRAFGRGLLSGLQHVHSVGLLHRDVKPSNVLLVTEGGTEVVKLCDFGWAIAADASDRTKCGTSAYSAPEVGHLDYTAASDMFSFGVTLYELITLKVKLHDKYIGPQLRELRDRTGIDDALLQTTERVCWELSTACLSCLQAVPRRRPPADPALLGVELAECKRDRHVGAGAFGDVFVYHWQWTPLQAQPKKVAVKMMHEAEYERTKTEVRMLCKSNQRSETAHIVGVLGHGTHIDTFSRRDLEYIIMPYCDQGTLAAKIATRAVQSCSALFVREEVVAFAVAILSGLSVAHANRVVHRDLKPENILFARENGRDVLKLSDFGLSATTSRSRYTGSLGTGAYMAPELLHDDGVRYHSEVDMFAFGVVLYELCTLENRFEGQTLGALLLAGNKLLVRIAGQLSQREHDIVTVVKECLNCDGTQRPNAGVCSERLGHSVDTVAAEDYIKVGSAVVAMNLAEMQELNGQSGQVVQILEDNKVIIQFEGARGHKLLDRSNVKQVAPAAA